MSFWGLELKPGQPQAYRPKNKQGKLHVTQATLGPGLGKEEGVVQCSIGGRNPIYLCSLLPMKNQCCPLNLEFGDELVEFSVKGERSIHLSGYLESYEHDEEAVVTKQETLTDREVGDQLKRSNSHLMNFGPNLPDKGERIRDIIAKIEEAKQRRVLLRSKMDCIHIH